MTKNYTPHMPRLVIGTAQWGSDYGVTNHTGQLSDATIGQILEGMNEFRIQDLDTAAAYGNAESRIAQLVPPSIRIHTKISGKDPGTHSIIERITDSLSALDRSFVNGVLIHDWYSLSSEEQNSTVRQLKRAQAESLTKKIGISIYEVDELILASQLFQGKFVTQIPVNILDQRFVHEHHNYPLVEFQARSIFLQGLLLERIGPLSQHPDLILAEKFNTELGLSPVQASLLFISQQTWLDSVVLAPTSLIQLQELHTFWEEVAENLPTPQFQNLESKDSQLIDPRTWN